jgi:hypothetical protein
MTEGAACWLLSFLDFVAKWAGAWLSAMGPVAPVISVLRMVSIMGFIFAGFVLWRQRRQSAVWCYYFIRGSGLWEPLDMDATLLTVLAKLHCPFNVDVCTDLHSWLCTFENHSNQNKIAQEMHI